MSTNDGTMTRAQKRATEQKGKEKPTSKKTKQEMHSTDAAASFSSSSSSPSPSLAQRFFTDGLLSLFAARACQHWYAAAKKEKSRGVRYLFYPTYSPSPSPAPFVRSPLRHHIARIERPLIMNLGSGSITTASDLPDLSCLPHLTHLKWPLEQLPNKSVAEVRGQMQAFLPDSLRHIDLQFNSNWAHRYRPPIDLLQLLIDRVSHLSSLKSFSLSLGDELDSDELDISALDLEPLRRLPHLRLLGLNGISHLTSEHFHTIRQMHTLRELHILDGKWEEPEELEALYQEPHQLHKLEKLNLDHTELNAEHMEHLQNLPGLTALDPYFMEPDALPFLAAFPHLTRLHLGEYIDDDEEDEFEWEVEAEELISALQDCPSLRDLALCRISLQDDDAHAIMQALPNLQTLRLLRADWASDLSWLKPLPQLERLYLVWSPFEAQALRALHYVPKLTQLMLLRCVELDPSSQSLLHPPSSLLPALTLFEYKEPDFDPAEQGMEEEEEEEEVESDFESEGEFEDGEFADVDFEEEDFEDEKGSDDEMA